MFISPMLLHKSDHPFDDSSYITELKADGIRLILSKFGGKVRLFTRHKNEVTSLFPELLNLNIPDNTAIDGEIVVTDGIGKPDFEAMMERFQSRKTSHKISYVVFDVMYYKNEKVTSRPLLERKEILNKIIPIDTPLCTKVQWIPGNAVQYFELIKQQGLEGIVQKKDSSVYEINKRSYNWLKVINYQYETVKVTGLRKDEFGVMMSFEDSRYAGILEFMPKSERAKIYKQHKELIISENEKFIYLNPKLKLKVKYRNLTRKGLLRIPSFVEWVS
ncbi:ATP-dependent DNA ligase [Niallia taxi]|uniref:ATP-dependent DNA ligase n=1 Tax=Niallia taxi TaxID=2499688 RepID=UPI00300A744B